MAKSFLLPISIDYSFAIQFNASRKGGHLSGSNVAYPSYAVWKDLVKIYEHQQAVPWLLGARKLAKPNNDVNVSKDF
jgi:hypothetical protein